MLVWVSPTVIFASSTNIFRNDASAERLGRIFLTTSSLTKPSAPNARARYTSAIPPAASFSRISYRPRALAPRRRSEPGCPLPPRALAIEDEGARPLLEEEGPRAAPAAERVRTDHRRQEAQRARRGP